MRTHSHKCQVGLLIRSVRPGLLWAPLLLPCQPCFPSPHPPGQNPIPPSPKAAGGCLGGLVLPGRPLHSPQLAPERQQWALRGLCGASLLPPPVPLAGLMWGRGGKRPVSLPTGHHGPQPMAGEGSLGPGEWKGDVIAGGEGPQCPPGPGKWLCGPAPWSPLS